MPTGTSQNDPGRWTFCPNCLTVYDDYGKPVNPIHLWQSRSPPRTRQRRPTLTPEFLFQPTVEHPLGAPGIELLVTGVDALYQVHSDDLITADDGLLRELQGDAARRAGIRRTLGVRRAAGRCRPS